MTRIAIITCGRNGTAANCLPALIAHPQVKVVGVFLAVGSGTNRARAMVRKLKKILRIGILGAWNGRRIRPWFQANYGDIESICRSAEIPFSVVKGLNSETMAIKLKESHADLGVSLGNGYISPRIFEIPRLGMINLHSEVLPAYQNAQTIIWPIFCNDPYTGFTIHEIDRHIDTGRILYQERHKIKFASTLEKTVRENKATIDKCVPNAVAMVCANIESLRQKALPQGEGRTFTTPSFWQFLRMIRNNHRFYRDQEQR